MLFSPNVVHTEHFGRLVDIGLSAGGAGVSLAVGIGRVAYACEDFQSASLVQYAIKSRAMKWQYLVRKCARTM